MEVAICSETGRIITRSEIISCISDNYKAAWGFRPRYDYSEYTLEELGKELEESENLAIEQQRNEILWERQERKARRRSEKRYQAIRKAAKSLPEPATYTIGEKIGLL